MAKMLAARLHALGEPMSVDTIDVPTPRPTDVLVRVKACGVVPNMANVINNWPTWFPHQPLPRFPAIFGSSDYRGPPCRRATAYTSVTNPTNRAHSPRSTAK